MEIEYQIKFFETIIQIIVPFILVINVNREIEWLIQINESFCKIIT